MSCAVVWIAAQVVFLNLERQYAHASHRRLVLRTGLLRLVLLFSFPCCVFFDCHNTHA